MMTDDIPSPGRPSAARWLPAVAAWCGLAIVWALSINGDSLWVDELTTAALAGASNWHDFVSRLTTTGSEVMMPLFSVYAWMWGRIAGTSEMALRLMNLPWALLTAAAWWWWLRRLKLNAWWLLLLASPYYCFYLNEARPYCMTFASAFIAICAVDDMVHAVWRRDPEGAAERILTVALAVCLGASVLNLFLAPVLVIYGGVLWVGLCNSAGSWCAAFNSIRDLIRLRRRTFAILGLLLGIYFAYYGAALLLATGMKHGGFNITNILFGLYEIAGMLPFGPPRYAMRDMQPSQIVGGLGWGGWILVAAWLAVGLMIVRRLKTQHRDLRLWALVLSAMGGLIVAGWIGGSRLWGRHLMFMAPVIFFAVAAGIQADKRRLGQILCLVLLLTLLVWGSLRLRFVPAYGKDPFRDAMAQVVSRHAADPAPVIWAAYRRGVEYYAPRYGVAPAGQIPGWIRDGSVWNGATIRFWHDSSPDYYLLLHRPDICDPTGAWRTMAGQSGTLVWESRGMRLFHMRGRAGI